MIRSKGNCNEGSLWNAASDGPISDSITIRCLINAENLKAAGLAPCL